MQERETNNPGTYDYYAQQEIRDAITAAIAAVDVAREAAGFTTNGANVFTNRTVSLHGYVKYAIACCCHLPSRYRAVAFVHNTCACE